jgi:hypothetical protein
MASEKGNCVSVAWKSTPHLASRRRERTKARERRDEILLTKKEDRKNSDRFWKKKEVKGKSW